MPETKTKNKSRDDLKKLILKIDYLDNSAKENWFNLVNNMTQADINETYAHFEEQIQKDKEIKFKIIVKEGLATRYLNKMQKDAKIFTDNLKINSKNK